MFRVICCVRTITEIYNGFQIDAIAIEESFLQKDFSILLRQDLVFYCCVANYHKLKIYHGMSVLCLGQHKVKIKVLSWLNYYLEFLGQTYFQAHSCCWQNSVPVVVKTEILVSYLAVSQGLLWASKGCVYSLIQGGLHLQANNNA